MLGCGSKYRDVAYDGDTNTKKHGLLAFRSKGFLHVPFEWAPTVFLEDDGWPICCIPLTTITIILVGSHYKGLYRDYK